MLILNVSHAALWKMLHIFVVIPVCIAYTINLKMHQLVCIPVICTVVFCMMFNAKNNLHLTHGLMKTIQCHVPLDKTDLKIKYFYIPFINYRVSSGLLWYKLLRCLFYILLRYWLYYKMRMFSMSSHLWLHVDHNI